MAVDDTKPKPKFWERLTKATQFLINGVNESYFSPGQPMKPMGPPDQAGRLFDYPIGVNLRIQPRPEDSGISFAELRSLADAHDVTRLLIETRKDQLEALQWTIKAKKDTDDKSKAKPEQLERIEQCIKFFQKPDGVTPFATWLRMLIEDLLVIDAPCVLVNTDNALETKFEVLDGGTIKTFLDGFGKRPLPPNPAYQQIVHGMPSWDYTTDEMIYMPRNPRTWKMYGMSPVQQIVLLVNIALRREISQLQYYTEGNVPDALIGTPKEWTPQQIAEFQRAWDALYEGNTAQRRHAKFVPGDVGKVMQTREVHLKDEFDEWLARVACFCFSMPPTAFVTHQNRATAQTAKAAAEEEGLAPLMRWVQQIMNCCLHDHLDQGDLEFDFVMNEEQDLTVQVDLLDKQVRNGTMTINEARELLGREAVDGGDTPMIYMGTQPIPVDMAAEGPPPPPVPMGGGGAPFGGPKQPPGKPGVQAKPGQKQLPGKKPANGAKPAAKPANGAKPGVGKSADIPFDIELGYNPDQARDEAGRWAGGGATFVPAQVSSIVHTSETVTPHMVEEGKYLEGVWKELKDSANPTERNQASAARIVSTIIDKAEKDSFADFERPTGAVGDNHFRFGLDGDGDVVGAVHTSFGRDKSTVEIKWLGSLAPGGGSRLLHDELDYAKGRGAVTVKLTSLPGAVGFYEKLGFNETAGEIGEYEAKIDNLTIMHKIMDGAGFVAIAADGSSGIAWDVVLPKRKKLKVEKAKKWRVVDVPSADDNPVITRAQKAMYRVMMVAFQADARATAKAVRTSGLKKAATDDAMEVVVLSKTGQIVRKMTQQYGAAASKTAQATIAAIGPANPEDLFARADEAAQEWAEMRAAELVGMKWVDGELIENPNAQWNIEQTTRDYLRDYLDSSFKDGKSLNDIADGIENMPKQKGSLDAFSAGRAMMIARTESAMAHGQGVLSGMNALADNGVHIMKQWGIGDGACDVCQQNEDDGPIELTDQWDNDGNPVDTVPSHPHCRCGVKPVVDDASMDNSGSSADDTTDEEDTSDEVDAVAHIDIHSMDAETFARAYNPDQTRDEAGRWTTGGSASVPDAATQAAAHKDLEQYVRSVSAFLQQNGSGQSTQGLVAQYGKAYTIDNKTFVGPRDKMHECFKNAALAAISGKGTYVEGYVSVHGVPVHHAWVADDEGHVRDTTIRSTKAVKGYYGIPFKTSYVNATANKTRFWGILSHTNPDLYEGKDKDFTKLAKYSENQPRDDRGRWTDGAGGDAAATDLLSQYPSHTDTKAFVDNLPAAQKQAIQDVYDKLRDGVPTNANVKDGGFKQDDGTYTPDRVAAHQAIIEKYLSPENIARTTPPEGQQPTLSILGGRGGSGKSYFTSEAGPVDAEHALYLNSDDVKGMLPGYQGWNASLVHDEANDLYNQIDGMARGLGLNVIHDATMRTLDSTVRQVDEFKASGYKVNGYYMFVPPEMSATRAMSRFMRSGRFVPPEVILNNRTSEQTFETVKPKLDKWAVYDNTGSSPVMVQGS